MFSVCSLSPQFHFLRKAFYMVISDKYVFSVCRHKFCVIM
jgi:hypothetical protein